MKDANRAREPLAYMMLDGLGGDRLHGEVTCSHRTARVEGNASRGFSINTGGYNGGNAAHALRHAQELLECVEAMQLLRDRYPDAFKQGKGTP